MAIDVIEFNINGGKLMLGDVLLHKVRDRFLIIRSEDETVNCDSGLCENVKSISTKVKTRCEAKDLLYYMNGDFQVAIDYNTYEALADEDITISYGKNVIIDQKKHPVHA